MMDKVVISVVTILVLQFISITAAAPCDPKCNGGQGVCESDGRCFCWWGWTGPNAVYIMTGPYKHRIKADYCTNACHYTHVYRNSRCARIPTPTTPSTTQPPTTSTAVPCDPKCNGGWGEVCQRNGRCLCYWGWSGPNAVYITSGVDKNRILADYCTKACWYNYYNRNPLCASIPTPTPSRTTQPSTTAKPTKAAPAIPCDPRCKGLHTGGNCSTADGRCYCFWGWTGPNAVYIETGTEKNRIKADYCTTPCHYTHDYLNPACASIPTPQVCSVPANKTVPPIPCDPQCGTGKYFGRGNCISNGRCLCWWGWTGPNACYVNGGTYNNRILADRCVDACHYTHNHRNYNCTNGSSMARPLTQLPGTASPGTASPGTASPGTASPGTASPGTASPGTASPGTASPGTASPGTASPGTASPGTASPGTGSPGTASPGTASPGTASPGTVSPGTASPTTKQKTTRQAYTTAKPTTQAATTTAKATTVQATTKQKTTTEGLASTTAKPTTQPTTTTEKATTVQPTTKQKTTTQASTTAKPTTQAATTAEKTTTVQPTTKQKTTSQGLASTTAKPTTQPTTTAVKTTTVGTTPTTKQKTTTQMVTTTVKATTTQAATTTEPPEPTEPTEPPEPTEPTEPGGLQVRGMLPDFQNQLQNDVDDSEVDDVNDEDEEEYKEPNKFSTIGLVVVLVVLLVCVTAFGVAVWWTYGNGNQCPSILRGYEPVSGGDTNTMMNEFPMSTHIP